VQGLRAPFSMANQRYLPMLEKLDTRVLNHQEN